MNLVIPIRVTPEIFQAAQHEMRLTCCGELLVYDLPAIGGCIARCQKCQHYRVVGLEEAETMIAIHNRSLTLV